MSLTNNFIANMPGPVFLLFYAIVVIITCMLAVIYKRHIQPKVDTNLIKVPNTPDPYEIAYLRGGHKEVLRLMKITRFQSRLVLALKGNCCGSACVADTVEERRLSDIIKYNFSNLNTAPRF